MKMKEALLILAILLVGNISFGQNKADAEKLVNEGVAYHDKGDYDGAISRYDKALALDKDNLAALSEKALTLNSLQKFEESILICQRAIETHPGENGLETVYVVYGNNLDDLKKTDKSVEIYDQGIIQFPDYYQLYFNKGISLASVKKYDEAILCFQKSVSLNPKHASSHNIIGRILYTSNRTPAILAYSRFLVIEPESKRAKENLSSLQELMNRNVEVTGKNSINLNISPDLLGDTTSNGEVKENSFVSTDLILTMVAALDYDKKNKKKTEVEQFIRKFETICESLKESQKDNRGFYWEYYVPYFIEMKDKNLVEPFAYIVFASSDNPDVSKWLKSNQSEIDKFYEWSKAFEWRAN